MLVHENAIVKIRKEHAAGAGGADRCGLSSPLDYGAVVNYRQKSPGG